MPARLPKEPIPALLLLFTLVTTFVVYFALTRVYLISDDFANMVTLVNRGIPYFLVEPFGGHMLLFRNALFALSFELFGLKAELYGWLTLITHLVNVALAFRLTRSLTGSPVLGAFAGIFWGASPLLAATLTWYSVHGQVVATMLLLIVLDALMQPRHQTGALPLRTALLWAFLLWLGATSFGVGIGIGIVFPLVLWLLRPSSIGEKTTRAVFLLLPIVVVATYFGSRWIFYQFNPKPFAESIALTAATGAVRHEISLFGLFLTVSTSGLLRSFFYEPLMFHAAPLPTPALAFLYASLVIGGLIVGDAPTRRRIAALLLLSFAIYGIIAFGRAATYRMMGVPMTVAAQTGRYHYTSTLPLAIAAALSVQALGRFALYPVQIPATVLVGWAAFTWYSYGTSGWAIQERAECREVVTSELRRIEAAVDARPPGTDVYLPNPPLPKTVTVFMGYSEIPGPAALFALQYPTNELHGRRVHFVEDEDHAGVFKAPENRRLSTLLVGPREHALGDSHGLEVPGQPSF